MPPQRVVVVDDEPDVTLLLEIQLRLNGFEVVGSAADGAEAMTLIRQERPDAVVLDLLMPRVNGFEAIAMIQHEFPGTGIVAYTGVAGDFVRVEMERLGVEVVLKTGDSIALRDALCRCVLTAAARQPSGGTEAPPAGDPLT
ncbi:MAG: hypothetical protein NVS3B21_18740 [Acidimicrobiales bacterium]